MPDKKERIYLEDLNAGDRIHDCKVDDPRYEVMKAVNTMRVDVGQRISRSELHDIIYMTQVEVTIVGVK